MLLPVRTNYVLLQYALSYTLYAIIYPYELAQSVVLVSRNVPVPGLARYVAPVVIRVRQAERVRSAALGYAGDQRCRGVSSVRGITLYIAVLGIVFDAVRYLPAGDPV